MGLESFSDIDLLDIGNTIQLAGGIWIGKDKIYLVPFPDETLVGELTQLILEDAEWERFLNQSDVLDIRGPGKAILRKSQRIIDQNIAWEVYKRDDYCCRYCGREAPLTVDHVVLWENGGPTIADNLLACCRRCNKIRGSMEYPDWLVSPEYSKVSGQLSSAAHVLNISICGKLDALRKITAKPRSR